MKNRLKLWLAIVALMLTNSALAAVAGKDYTVLEPAQPTAAGGRIEVLEFFGYPCPHCHHLHPALSAWEKTLPKDVGLTYVPVIFRDSWEPMAYTFYALDTLGQLPRLHGALFDAWNVQHIELTDANQIANFVVQHGVDKAKFSEAYRSFSVQSKVVRSKQLTQSFRIMGTPTVIVDGRFSISGLQPPETLRVLNELLEQVRKERAGKKR